MDPLLASLTRTAIPLIHYAATDVYLLSTLSHTARKRRQSTAGCEPARSAQLRHPATWLPCATHACMWYFWMTSCPRCKYAPCAYSETASIASMNVASQRLTGFSQKVGLRLFSAIGK